MKNQLLSIVFIDVQGYTRRTAVQTREDNEKFVTEIRDFVTQHLDRYGGRLVKSMGDGFMAAFDSPSNSVQCGLEMQRKLETRNANILNPDHFVRFRIGINTGEVGIDEHGDLFGDAVNIAARIESFAEPNEVFISEATYLAMNRNEFGTVDLGPQNFKNATREIRVYKISKNGAAPAQAASGAKVVSASQTAAKVPVSGNANQNTSRPNPLKQSAADRPGHIIESSKNFLAERKITAFSLLALSAALIFYFVYPPSVMPGDDMSPRHEESSSYSGITSSGQNNVSYPDAGPRHDISPGNPVNPNRISRPTGDSVQPQPERDGPHRKVPGRFREKLELIESMKRSDDFEGAISEAEKLLSIMEAEGSTPNPPVFLQIADLYLRTSRADKAEEYFSKALNLAEKNPRMLKNIRDEIQKIRRNIAGGQSGQGE